MLNFTRGLLTASCALVAFMATTYALEGSGLHPAIACLLCWAAGASLAIPTLPTLQNRRQI